MQEGMKREIKGAREKRKGGKKGRKGEKKRGRKKLPPEDHELYKRQVGAKTNCVYRD